MKNKILLISLFLFVLIIGYYIDLDRQWMKLSQAREQTHSRQATLKETQQKILQIDDYKIVLAKIRKEFEEIKITPPEAVSADTNTDAALTKYPLSELSMAGVIYQTSQTNKAKNQIWALIKAPDEHVYAVTIGDPIGLEGGKVSEIISQKIIIQQENQEEKKSVTIQLR